MRFQILLSVLFLNCLPIWGQQLFVQPYAAETYKGATQNWEVDQDEQGILYFANNDGVLTYDGKEWNLLSLPNKDFVFSIALDLHGKIYVASYSELGYFEKDSLGTHQYHSLVPKLPEKYHDFKYLSQIKVFHDTVFFVDYEAIYLYANNEFEILDEPNAKIITQGDKLYFVKKDGLYNLKNKSIQPSHFNEELKDFTLKWIDSYAQNSFLILDDKNQLWQLHPQAPPRNRLQLISSELNHYLKDIPRFKMVALDNGNIAILTYDELLFFNKEGKPLYTITKNMIGEDFTHRILYEDRKHNLWVTTTAAILQVITSSPVSYYDRHNGLSSKMLSLGKKSQHRYAGTVAGIFYKESKSAFIMLPGTEGEAWNFYNFHGKLYVAHRTGVIELKGKKATQLIEHNYVHSLCELKNFEEHMLMGTYNTGIWLLKRKGNTWTKSKIKGFEEETRFMQEDEEGNIWISHYNKGIFKLRLNEQMDSVTAQSFYSKDNGLPSDLNNRVYRLKDGRIIVTTTGGIYQYDKSRNRFIPAEEFNRVLGANLCVYNLTENENGDVYFWAGQAQNKEFAGALKKQADGSFALLLTPFNKIAIPIRDLRIDVDAPLLVAAENEIWIGNNLKLMSYDPFQETFYNESFNTYIKNIWVKDSVRVNNAAKIPYRLNSLRVGFFSAFYEDPDKTEYQYKLDDFQEEWSGWSNNHEAVFTNLPHGSYTFSVRARNLYGTISEPQSLSFYILPPWYKTWWSILIYLAFAVSCVAIIVHLNTKRIRAQKLKLEKQVRKKTKKLRARNKKVLEQKREILKQAEELEALNLTKDKLFSIVSHDLRAPIKQIQVVMNLMELNHVSEEEFKAFLPKFKDSIDDTVNLTDNLLHWANSQMEGLRVKPSRINVKEIVEENYQLFKPVADGKNIQLINDIRSDLLAFADKDMIRLVLRNLVNNAVKFTKKGESVVIGAQANHENVVVFVKDKGIGLSKDEIDAIMNKKKFTKQGTFGEKGAGIGLLLCQEFIEKNGGAISIESKPGHGSKFSFSLPSC